MRRPWWGSSRTSYTTPVSTFQVVDEQIIEHGGLLPIVKFSPKEDDFWVVRVSSDGKVAPMRGCLQLWSQPMGPLCLWQCYCIYTYIFAHILVLYLY